MGGKKPIGDRTSPPSDGFAVTPSNTVDLPKVIRGFIVGVAGDVKVTFLSGNSVVLPAMVAGVEHPGLITRIWATGTAAQGIVGLTDAD